MWSRFKRWLREVDEVPRADRAEDSLGAFTLLEPGIWLGAKPNYIPPHISAVLNLCLDKDVCEGIEHCQVLHIKMSDSEFPGMEILDQGLDQIEIWSGEGRQVLIHCYSGRSRTGLFALGWLMRRYNLARDEAWARALITRPILKPNFSYLEGLKNHESEIRSR